MATSNAWPCISYPMFPDGWSVCHQSLPLAERSVWQLFHQYIHTQNVQGDLSNMSVYMASGLWVDFHCWLKRSPVPLLKLRPCWSTTLLVIYWKSWTQCGQMLLHVGWALRVLPGEFMRWLAGQVVFWLDVCWFAERDASLKRTRVMRFFEGILLLVSFI